VKAAHLRVTGGKYCFQKIQNTIVYSFFSSEFFFDRIMPVDETSICFEAKDPTPTPSDGTVVGPGGCIKGGGVNNQDWTLIC
jgi:hypothetical protein